MIKNLTRRDLLVDTTLMCAGASLNLSAFAAPRHITAMPVERRANFDTGWRFFLGDATGAEVPEFADSAWQTLDLPHDWSIQGPFSQDAPAKGEGAYLPTGFGWYRKQFTLPSGAVGKRVAIEFDGVYQRSEVWINGHALGMRPYGFISFAYDLTPFLRPAGQANVIAVRVDNSLQLNCRWYAGSGIYRHTWLRVTEPIHIAHWGTFVQTPSVTTASARVMVSTLVKNEGAHDAACEVTWEIFDPSGALVQHAVATGAVAPGADHTLTQELAITTPALWSVATPHMYTMRTTVRSGGVPVDAETTPFGVREIAFDVDKGFLLNGAQVKLNGVCIHGDCGSVGTAVPERMWERRLELLRAAGCNAIRLSHNPAAPELMDMLDRMGFLVMAEAFDEWKDGKAEVRPYGYSRYFDEWSDRDLTALVQRDRNHPSIILWSAGNEIRDQTDPQGPATLQRLKDIIHRNDSTRLITAACDEIAADGKATPDAFLAKLDVVGYNYMDRWRDRREKYYSIDRHDFPQRRFVGTESSALGGVRGQYRIGSEQEAEFRGSNTLVQVEQMQKFIQTYDYVSGDFMWTGIDYLGEARWPNKNSSSGFLDTCGFPKDSFYFYQSLWTKPPMLHVLPHWNWAGSEGDVIPVTCYTNCDTVELFLNGKSMGVKGYAFPRPGMVQKYGTYPPRARAKQTTADLHLSWDVPYAAGTLTAKGTIAGVVVQTVEVMTTGVAARLELVADRTTIGTGSHDVSHVTVRVLDANGRMVPTADDAIAFALRGEGKILGVDNGQPDSHESYQANTRKAFNGMALVVLQGTRGKAGSMTLSASASGLAGAELHVQTT